MSKGILRIRFLVPGGIVCVFAVNKFRQNQSKRAVTYSRLVTTPSDICDGDKVNVLVTGGCGVLGKSLVKSLIQDGGYNVHSLDVYIPDPSNRDTKVTSYISSDISKREDFELAVKETKPQAVFHTAALLPKVEFSASDIHRVNHEGTKVVVNACKEMGVARLVFTSSCSVYLGRGTTNAIGITEDSPIPDESIDTYSKSKKLAEHAVLASNGGSLATCALRSAFISHENGFKRLLKRSTFYVGNGMARFPEVDVEYLAKAHVLAEKKLRSAGIAAMGTSPATVGGNAYNITGEAPCFKDRYSYSPNPDSDITIYGHAKPRSLSASAFHVLAWTNVVLYHFIGYKFDSFLIPSAIKYMKCDMTLNGDKARMDLGLPKHPPWQATIEKYVKRSREKDIN